MLRSLLLVLPVLCTLGSLPAQTVSDQDVDRVVEQFEETRRRRMTGTPDPAAATALGELAIEGLSTAQFLRLCDSGLVSVTDKATRERFLAVGREFAQAKDADGAEVQSHLVRAVFWPGREASPEEDAAYRRERLDALVKAAMHDGLPAAMAEGRCARVLLEAYFVRDNTALAERGVFERLSPLCTEAFPASEVRSLLVFFRCLSAPEAGVPAEEVQRVRKVLAGTLEKALQNEDLEANEKKYLGGQQAFVNGAAARGELLGHPAPRMDVRWSYPEGAAASMPALRDKIVVIDFWATWCGPCVASFPHLRELVERYEGLPVEFVGVTSLQGWVADQGGKDIGSESRDLTPEQELELMTPWCEAMEVTWTVWVTEQNCFNGDYAVSGIPHVAIVGADGKVARNDLHPSGTAVEDAIDVLLKGMGLTPPARPASGDGSGRGH